MCCSQWRVAARINVLHISPLSALIIRGSIRRRKTNHLSGRLMDGLEKHHILHQREHLQRLRMQ